MFHLHNRLAVGVPSLISRVYILKADLFMCFIFELQSVFKTNLYCIIKRN